MAYMTDKSALELRESGTSKKRTVNHVNDADADESYPEGEVDADWWNNLTDLVASLKGKGKRNSERKGFSG